MRFSSGSKLRIAGALAVVGLATAIATSYVAALKVQTHARSSATTDLRSSVNALRLEVRNGIQVAEASASGAASGPALTSALGIRDAEAASAAVQSLMGQAPALISAAVYDANGWLVARVPSEPGVVSEIGPDAEASPAATSPKLIKGDSTYAIKYPVQAHEGTTLGSLIVEVSLRGAAPGIEVFRLGATGRASIVDRSGTVLLSGQAERVGTRLTSGITGPTISRWQSASIEGFSPVVGRDELIAFGPADQRLGVMVTRSRAEAFGPVMRFGWDLLSGLVLLMILVAGTAVIANDVLRDERRQRIDDQAELAEVQQLLPGISATLHDVHTNIAGLVRTLQERGSKLPGPAAEQLLARIGANSAVIERMSERLHFVALIESDSLRTSDEVSNLKLVADDALRNLSVDLTHHRVQVVVPDELVVAADTRSVRRIIEEIVLNAARFSARGSLIIVRARRSDTDAIISIDDEGEGIAAEALPVLFTRFGRGQNSSGQGIGLWIAREIVTRAGGELWCEPEKDRGSTFTCRLPATPRARILVDLSTGEGLRTLRS